MSDKRTTLDETVAQLRSGMTIGIGGWGSRRKPMAFVRALLRTDITDLTVVTYGGPDLGLLCSAGKVKRAYYGFVSLDSPPFYDPWFAKARANGAIEAREMDEGMLRCGLQAAAQRLRLAHRRLPSGAGHDAALFANQGIPTAMLFVRNGNGSHNPDEAMALDDFAAGARVLARTMAARAALTGQD